MNQKELFRTWSTCLALSALFYVAAISYVAFVYYHPPEVESVTWPVINKLWMIYLYGLSAFTLYLPYMLHSFFSAIKAGKYIAPGQSSTDWSRRFRFRRIVLSILFGLTAAVVTYSPDTLQIIHRASVNIHEAVHLGPLLSIDQGNTAYVEARTQYGPGHQLVTYALMKGIDFSMAGFRISFLLLNFLAQFAVYAIAFFSLGWFGGILCVLFAQVILSGSALSFVGWAVLLRWMGPVAVGALLPLIIWGNGSRILRLVQTSVLGAGCGVVSWYSQENFSTCMITAAIVYAAAFSRKSLSLADSILALLVFCTSLATIFLALLAFTVGAANLQEAIPLPFKTGSYWLKGVANTYWADTENPYTRAFRFTSILALATTGLALYSRRQAAPSGERNVALVLGTSAAVISVIPITLMRSDQWHFVGPISSVVPVWMAATLVFLPGILSSRPAIREAFRVGMAAVFLFTYIAPISIANMKPRVLPDVRVSWERASDLWDVLFHWERVSSTSVFDRRMGQILAADQRCNRDLDCGELRTWFREVNERIAGRSAFVASEFWSIPDSSIYFFADLKIGTLEPSNYISIYTKPDLERTHELLSKNIPECVVSNDHIGKFGLTAFLLEKLGNYSQQDIRGGHIFCRTK